LEHLPNLENQITVLKKLLKANGTLIIAVPNYKSFDATYYKNFWAAFDVPRHLWHFSQASISKLFLKQHMEVIKTLPMTFDSYYVSMLSEKYKKGSLNVFNGFRVGWLSNVKAKRSGEYSSLIYIIKNS
jgi:predicted SAM-dependent methyltransferase